MPWDGTSHAQMRGMRGTRSNRTLTVDWRLSARWKPPVNERIAHVARKLAAFLEPEKQSQEFDLSDIRDREKVRIVEGLFRAGHDRCAEFVRSYL